MATDRPPVNVSELLARVTQSVTNISKHRAAMAQVAAQAKATVPAPPVSGASKG